YGTDSVRALLVDAANGDELAIAVFEYPRWKKGLYCDAAKNQFRQHPLDYIEGLESTVCEVLQKVPHAAQFVRAISIDTTGSTPVAVNKAGIPLALTPQFSENPNAMFILWKDHTAVSEADEINKLCRTWGGVDYSKYSGGVYSSEWFWAKILYINGVDEEVASEAFSWVEHCDWMPAFLTGNSAADKLFRSRCAAGHKAMWHKEWNGYPSVTFFNLLDFRIAAVRETLPQDTVTSDKPVGTLSLDWAKKLSLSTNVLIGSGALDAHIGAVGGEIKPYYLSKVIGTSTCDMMIVPDHDIASIVKGICGQVDGSIIPGLTGMEAGQSAFGDIYAWFKKLLLWPVENILLSQEFFGGLDREKLVEDYSTKLISALTEEAQKIPLAESSIIALDWMNGRRTPDANQNLKGALTGLSLGTNPPHIFRALVEATAFGSKAIVERFLSEGIRIDGIIALGGVAKKSPFVMQTLADVLNMPIKVARTEQTCALGATMYAAVVAGIYASIEAAQKAMGKGFGEEYIPDPGMAKEYEKLYDDYKVFGEFIENQSRKTQLTHEFI
ncbi:MAG: ribulokinase, partial [Pyrinomonadaceae bacterium]|nr:ribulokinase [Sphingobacteriaceae bacterium]